MSDPIERERTRNVNRKPTRTELDRALRLGLINLQKYRHGLSEIGYGATDQDRAIDRIRETIGGKGHV